MPYQLEKSRVRRRFEDAAQSYDEFAFVQRHMADELLERLNVVRLEPVRILDAGCGTAYAAHGLGRRFPQAELVLLDFAAPMLRRADRGAASRAQLLCADVERMPFESHSMDMIFSNAVLQWCDPDRTLAEFQRVLRPDGLLTFSTYGPDTLGELRAAWRQVDEGVHVHPFMDMHDIGDALVRHQFCMPVMDVDYLTVTHRDLRSALRDLKKLGAGNAATGRGKGLTGKQSYRRLERACEGFRNGDGLLETTYEIVYGHAWAPTQTRVDGPAGEVAVPLTRLRRRTGP